MGTTFPKGTRRNLKWKLLDAHALPLGRLAVQAARLLMGKDQPDWTPFLDRGSGVIVINASKVRLTGRKLTQKVYRHYSGYPGGLKEISAHRRLQMQPEEVVRDAVLGMLPKSKLADRMARRLRVYAGSQHPHAAQEPEPLKIAV